MGALAKCFKVFLSFVFVVGLAASSGLILSPTSWGIGPKNKDPNTTLCASKAARDTSDSDKIGVGEKVKTGTKPLFVSMTSSVSSNGLAFLGDSAEVTLIQVPEGRACTFDKILVNVKDGCNLADSHPVQVRFNCTDGGQTLYNTDDAADNTAITPDNQTQNFFEAANTVLGLGLTFDNACNLASDQDAKDCAAAVCDGIKTHLTSGDTLALSTAGDLGALIGSMQTTIDRCVTSSDIFEYHFAGDECTPDEIAAKTAYDALTAAPEEHVQVNSDGAGGYLLSILTGSTVFTPGDFFQIDMDSCAADFLTQ